MAARPPFFAELKRRNVLRAAVLYIGAVWALSQGISQLSGPLELANWVTVWFLIACAIAFPFWVAFAWFYEFTPKGLKRESEVAPSESITHSIARKLDFAIIGVLVVAVALLASGYFVKRDAATGANDTSAPFNPPPNTIAVLPFTNLDGDKTRQYFSDGITEELTNALGQNAALTVIAWDTASRYRGSRELPQAIGKALNVANLLHGSIEREGGAVRVIAELVNTRTGAQVWSSHYDDSLANIFQVQDKISASISGALKVKFAAATPARTVNPQAHDLVLQAIALMDKARTAAPYEQARTLLEQAVALDPDYAEAHAQLANAWSGLRVMSLLSSHAASPKIHAEASRALALDPRNVTALVLLGGFENDPAKAQSDYERVLAIDPGNVHAHLDYAEMLPQKQRLAQDLEAVQLDPDSTDAQNALADDYLDSGEYRQALVPFRALIKLDPHSADSALGLALTYALLHNNQDAVKAFDLVQPDTELGKAVVAAGRLTYQSLLDPKLHPQALAAVQALRRRTDLDLYSVGDVFQLLLALGQNDAVLALLPHWCASLPAACADLSVLPEWLPLRGDPHFEALVKQYDTTSQLPASTSSAPSSP